MRRLHAYAYTHARARANANISVDGGLLTPNGDQSAVISLLRILSRELLHSIIFDAYFPFDISARVIAGADIKGEMPAPRKYTPGPHNGKSNDTRRVCRKFIRASRIDIANNHIYFPRLDAGEAYRYLSRRYRSPYSHVYSLRSSRRFLHLCDSNARKHRNSLTGTSLRFERNSVYRVRIHVYVHVWIGASVCLRQA